MAGEWDVSLPINHTELSAYPEKIRELRSATKVIVAKEHLTPGDGNVGAEHRKGSAVVFLQSTMPTLGPDGVALSLLAGQPATNHDDGRLAVISAQSNRIVVYVATSTGPSTGWKDVQIRRVKLAETMNANSMRIVSLAAGTQSGHAMHVGQIDTGYFTISKATATLGLVSLKLYGSTGSYLAKSGQAGIVVANSKKIGGYDTDNLFKSLNTLDHLGNSLGKNKVYRAFGDGFVFMNGLSNGAAGSLKLDTSNPPTETVISQFPSYGEFAFISCAGIPVAKNEYFEFVATGTVVIYWRSIGPIHAPQYISG